MATRGDRPRPTPDHVETRPSPGKLPPDRRHVSPEDRKAPSGRGRRRLRQLGGTDDSGPGDVESKILRNGYLLRARKVESLHGSIVAARSSARRGTRGLALFLRSRID